MANKNMPKLTEEQRKEALAKAIETRVKRAEVKQRLKNRELTMKDLIEQSDDPIIGGIKVSTALMAMPGYGKKKVGLIMEQLGIAESRRIAGLGSKQRKELIDRVG